MVQIQTYITFALYLSTSAWATIVFPECGGPKTHTLQGGRGKWGAR